MASQISSIPNNAINFIKKKPLIILTLKVIGIIASTSFLTAAIFSGILVFKYPKTVVQILGKFGNQIIASKALKISIITLPSFLGIFSISITIPIFCIKKTINETISATTKISKDDLVLTKFWEAVLIRENEKRPNSFMETSYLLKKQKKK